MSLFSDSPTGSFWSIVGTSLFHGCAILIALIMATLTGAIHKLDALLEAGMSGLMGEQFVHSLASAVAWLLAIVIAFGMGFAVIPIFDTPPSSAGPAAALNLMTRHRTPMAKIVDLKTYRARIFHDRVFGPWERRFKEAFDATSQLADLSDNTLLFLARPGDAGTLAFYEIIMGTLDLGMAAEFYALDKQNQLTVVDTHLFLVDQTRFELMRRLGWVVRFPCQANTLVKLIQEAERFLKDFK